MRGCEMKRLFRPLIGLGASCLFLIGVGVVSHVKSQAELPGFVAAERERMRPTPEFSSQEEAHKACLEHLKSLPAYGDAEVDYKCHVSDTANSRGSGNSSYYEYLNKTTGVPWHEYEEYGAVYTDSPLRDSLLPEREFIFSK